MRDQRKYSMRMIKHYIFSLLKSIFKTTLIFFIFFSFYFSGTDHSSASSIRDRIRSCAPPGGGDSNIDVTVETLDFNFTNGGKDNEFELDNPVCLSIIATDYALVKTAVTIMNHACDSGQKVPRIKPSLLQDSIDITRAGIKAVQDSEKGCIAAWVAAIASYNSFLINLGVTFAIAKDGFNNTHLCGSEWTNWNANSMLKDKTGLKATIESNITNWANTGQNSNLSMNNLEYREWIFDGVEKEDNSDNACPDVTRPKQGDKYPPQRYYMRGTQMASYNCEQYNLKRDHLDPLTKKPLTVDRARDFQTAYQCCTERSKESICLQYGNNYKFCKSGDKCSLTNQGRIITYQANYAYSNNLICAHSYSVCPFNFNIGGGTTDCDYYQDGTWDESQQRWTLITADTVKSGKCKGKSEVRNDDCTYNDKAGKCKNYCQMLNHCVVVDTSYTYQSSLSSPYFSVACLDFVGDSKNNVNYDTGVFAGVQKHFTTPVAQCVRETMENVFLNRAGHSLCQNPGEIPGDGLCSSNLYIYKKGDQVANQSFFSVIQERVQFLVRFFLIFAVVFVGIKTLSGGKFMEKKEILMFLVKIGLVMWFATGNAWQQFFFDGVYRASEAVSTVVLKIKTSAVEQKRDGCQFGQIAYVDPKVDPGQTLPDQNNIKYQTINQYPQGKEYLAIWDTLDCKIALYLGFGPTATVANIAKLIIAGFITTPIGLYWSVMLLLFGIYMIVFALRALYIFLASSVSIILMVYVSPIIIPLALFKKTENIFKNWMKELISFSLQPIILFAYIGVFVTAFDTVVIGSAAFTGNAPTKTINCDKQCYTKNGVLKPIPPGKSVYDNDVCNLGDDDVIVDPTADSVACLVNVNNYKNWPGLEIVGIALPMLTDLFSNAGREKILTIIKALVIIYLLSAFTGQIPGIASNLTGGTKLPGTDMNVKTIMNQAQGLIGGLQKRGMGASKKATKAGLGGLINKAKSTTRKNFGSESKAGASKKADSDASIPAATNNGGNSSIPANSNKP